jgi:hypothetical protein
MWDDFYLEGPEVRGFKHIIDGELTMILDSKVAQRSLGERLKSMFGTKHELTFLVLGV